MAKEHSRTYRIRLRAKLARMEEMERMLRWIAKNSTDKAAIAIAESALK